MAFAQCELKHIYVVIITGALLKDGNPVPFTSKKELEDNLTCRHFVDVCIKLRTSITSKTGVPYEMIGCDFSSFSALPNQTHVIVNVENKGSAEVHMFVRELFSECERRRIDVNSTGLHLQRPFETAIGPGYATIRIAMKFAGDDLTGNWLSVYGSATEVMHIAATTCSKYDKMAKTEKISVCKEFTCVVNGPHGEYMKAEFILRFESDEADTIRLTKDDLEKQNAGTGYGLTNIQINVLTAII